MKDDLRLRQGPGGAALLALALSLGAGSTGCGYDDPDAIYYAGDESVSTLVEPDQVKAWIDAGYRTEDGHRVLILDCVPNPPGAFPFSDMESWFAGDVAKIKTNMAAQYGVRAPQHLMVDGLAAKGMLGHLPGAIPSISHEGYEVTDRSDGPMLAEHEVGTGAFISQLASNLGVRKDDVLVLTTSRLDYPGFCAARLYWTLRYWGFSRTNVKVLNGGNKAWAAAGNALEKGVRTPATIAKSDFDVSCLARRFFDERISLGEVMDVIDSGRTALPDDDADQVVVLDTRQPPAAYFFTDADQSGTPDVYELEGYSFDAATKTFDVVATADAVEQLTLDQVMFGADHLAIPFSATSNPPINPADAHGLLGLLVANGAPLAIPLGAKPAAFEGVMRGAKVTKTPTYNITVPALSLADGRYKSKEDLLAVFAAAGIDGTKPIITYCNSGALAAIYYYVLKEICGFDDVRMYDGSWGEWANLTAYEPASTEVVQLDAVTVYPMYPAPSPAVVIFSGANANFTWSPDAKAFTSAATGATLDAALIRLGGSLAGMPRWDAVHRSQNVLFRASATVNGPNRTYRAGVNWPTVTTFPDYDGPGHDILDEDESYQGQVPTTSGDGAPSAFVPVGGGC
ncbi:MAG: hypothetical protein CVU56_14115 [Deltaproteobacteria bacterium HGW-Deltaproteobacteria-14]|jgi:3-mercaptopyruvate sulfurtransferase SseA|nr:MAG: hypothetical protein CVU56_14115 [Deltaproteobacteria bacterium HGW-Deltaproteobacteria-14]